MFSNKLTINCFQTFSISIDYVNSYVSSSTQDQFSSLVVLTHLGQEMNRPTSACSLARPLVMVTAD